MVSSKVRVANKALKVFLVAVLCIFVIWAIVSFYLRHSASKVVTEKALNEIIGDIDAAPQLPQGFKDVYCKVYPGVFNTGFTGSLLNSLLSDNRKPCLSRRITDAYFWHCIPETGQISSKLNYIGFTWLIEDNVTLEKCFEFDMINFHFTQNARGIYEAACTFYNKPLDSLLLDEQLGLIIMIDNPSYYDRIRHPGRLEESVKKVKERIVADN